LCWLKAGLEKGERESHGSSGKKKKRGTVHHKQRTGHEDETPDASEENTACGVLTYVRVRKGGGSAEATAEEQNCSQGYNNGRCLGGARGSAFGTSGDKKKIQEGVVLIFERKDR